MNTFASHSTSGMIGMAVFLAGMQFSIGSVEQSSRYSVENFSKDQKTLQNAANALSTYIIIAIFWTLATCLVLYADYGNMGIFWGILTNSIFVLWLVFSYLYTFKKVARDNKLQMPKLFNFSGIPSRIDNV